MDDNGELIVDYIGRFENLNLDVKTIFSRLNIEASLPHLNKGNRGEYYSFYDNEAKEMVETLYSDDISYFNYSF